LLQLGLFRIGYLTAVPSTRGDMDIVIHGADGNAIATVDKVELAVDLADRLGLALVPLH